jgi:5,10-methylenetetrahydromethanopterin reductase
MSVEAHESVGAIIPTITTPEEIVPMAAFIEDAGFGELWVAEDYFFYGGLSSAGLALQATREITVGIGILSSVVRHPAVTAMEIGTLAGAFPGRFQPGIGHGVPFWTQQMGLLPKKPLSVFREVVTLLRRLLGGETVTQTDGHFHLDAVSLVHPCDDVELLAGVIGPKSLELAGEITDGTVLSVLAGSKYVEYAREHTSAGMKKVGRSGVHKLPTFTLFAVDEDGDKARASAREVVAFYLAAVGPTPLTGVYDINESLIDMIERGGAETIAAEMPADWLEELAVAGTPEECATKIENLLAAGATSVVLFPTPISEGLRPLEIAAREVLPKVGR